LFVACGIPPAARYNISEGRKVPITVNGVLFPILSAFRQLIKAELLPVVFLIQGF
jgi:hypothetical protein